MATPLPIPHLPPFYDMGYTNEKGNLTPEALLFNDQMWKTLNQIVEMFNDGIQNPNKTTAEITVLRDNDAVPVGTVWFNTSLAKLQVKTALGAPGTIETIQSV